MKLNDSNFESIVSKTEDMIQKAKAKDVGIGGKKAGGCRRLQRIEKNITTTATTFRKLRRRDGFRKSESGRRERCLLDFVNYRGF